MKTVATFLLALLLTACGGGGTETTTHRSIDAPDCSASGVCT